MAGLIGRNLPDIGATPVNLRPAISTAAQRMKPVQKWMNELADAHRLKHQTLGHIRSAIKLAFDEAISEGLMGTSNPATEFKLRVPRNMNDEEEREPLTLKEMSALVGGSLRRVDKEHELNFCTRLMLVLIGLLAGLRPGEICGLMWDCVDLEGRVIYVHRAWRKGKGIVRGTKTGKRGLRSVPMSPILVAAFAAYRERLRSLGYPTEGEVPVLRTKQTRNIVPLAISRAHWPAVAAKAGFVDKDGGLDRTAYVLRTTCLTLWRAVGMASDIGFSKPPKTLRFCIVDVSQIVPNPRSVWHGFGTNWTGRSISEHQILAGVIGRLVWHGFGTDLARRANLSNPYPRLAAAADLAFLTSLRRCAMLPPSGSWRAGHVDYLACLPDRVHGRHNGRQQCSGPLVVAGRRSGPLEILRDGDRTDVWRP